MNVIEQFLSMPSLGQMKAIFDIPKFVTVER